MANTWNSGPQTITQHGEPVVMVVAMDTWKQLATPRPSLKDYLRAAPLEGLEIEREPPRFATNLRWRQ